MVTVVGILKLLRQLAIGQQRLLIAGSNVMKRKRAETLALIAAQLLDHRTASKPFAHDPHILEFAQNVRPGRQSAEHSAAADMQVFMSSCMRECRQVFQSSGGLGGEVRGETRAK